MKKRDLCPVGTCAEMESLRAHLRALQQERSDKSHEHLEAQLQERIKELNCLYVLTNVIEQHENSLDKILQEAVNLLPVSWQYPEICCARITYREQVFKTGNFRATQWRQKSPIVISGRQEGLVEVHYLKKMPPCAKGECR